MSDRDKSLKVLFMDFEVMSLHCAAEVFISLYSSSTINQKRRERGSQFYKHHNGCSSSFRVLSIFNANPRKINLYRFHQLIELNESWSFVSKPGKS